MFPISKDVARRATVLLDADTKDALERMLQYYEESLVKQISAELSADNLRVIAAKIDIIRNLRKFEGVIRQNAH